MPPTADPPWLLRGGTLVTLESPRVLAGDLLLEGGRITALGPDLPAPAGARLLDCAGCLVMPGLVQAHVHLCQTLCRGHADDLPLLRWLRERLWPYEAALDEGAMAAAARLGCAELLRGGTTTILDMGTVRHQDALMEAAARTGLRATMGKAMMDLDSPAGLLERTADSLAEADALCRRWHGAPAYEGRIRYAYAPRFLLSCTDELLRAVAERVAAADGVRLHSHAAEQREEVALAEARLGESHIGGLQRLGVGGPRAVLAHCVHVDEAERARLAQAGTHVAHCPSSNLKLGSGVAKVAELLAAGVNVALGADGAPCNNRLDGLQELRLAALLQKGRLGAAALPAWSALELATLGGARALGLEAEIGSLKVGKRADVVVLRADTLHGAPGQDPAALLVYAAAASDVRDVFVDGHRLVAGGALTERTGLADEGEVVARAREQAARVLRRAGLA